MQRLGLNAARLQHKVMHKDNRPEGNENIFPEEQAHVVGRRRHRAQTIAHLAGQGAEVFSAAPSAIGASSRRTICG